MAKAKEATNKAVNEQDNTNSANDTNELIALLKKQLEEQRKYYEEQQKQLEELKKETREVREESKKTYLDMQDLSRLKNRLVGDEGELADVISFDRVSALENGRIKEYEVAKIKTAHGKGHEVINLITSDFVLRQGNFAAELAEYFAKKPTDLDFSPKTNKILISRGITTKKKLELTSRNMLANLITSVYSEQDFIDVIRELEEANVVDK